MTKMGEEPMSQVVIRRGHHSNGAKGHLRSPAMMPRP